MTPLKVAVVGCGHLGSIHARKLAKNANTQLTHVVDPLEAHRSAVACETGALPTNTIEELFHTVDAAIVATPTSAHAAAVGQLLSHGIHVFVEKPIAPSSSTAAELCRLAENHGCLLQVGHVERFNPIYVAARKQLSAPKYIATRRTSGFTFRSVDIGAVFDLMIHDIDLVLDLAQSEVTRVTAFGCALLGNREDTAEARLEFANGCIADLHASRVEVRRERRMQVLAPEYRATLDLDQLKGQLLTPCESVRNRQFDAEQFSSDERRAMGPEHYKSLFEEFSISAEPADAIEAEQANFIGAIRGIERIHIDGRAGQRAVEIAERILEACDQHQWDGHANGRIGPTFSEQPAIIRPSWSSPAEIPQRKAG